MDNWDRRCIKDSIRYLLDNIGEDVRREGLRETPERVAKAWEEWASGYKENAAEVLKAFKDGASSYDEMVLVKDIPWYSHCVIGSTFVETPRGRVPISRLSHGDLIYTMDPQTQELDIVACEHPRVTRHSAELVAVHTDNDTLICTPDHRILLTTGQWREAKDLKNGDRLASLYRSGYTSEVAKGRAVVYPKLLASRYKRAKEGLKINGQTLGVPEHQFVYAWKTGQPLSEGRMRPTHHINEQVWDNDPNNLTRISLSQHNIEHQRTQKLANNENRKQAAALASGREETRAKRSASVRAHWDNLKTDPVAYAERTSAMSKGIQEARNHIVFGVQRLDYCEDVWCMGVPQTNLFFANGIAVHNCEHHLAAMFGTATIGYIPNGRIVGLSKLPRLVDVFARRLQVQERLTVQIADALDKHLQPIGVGVILKARHLCLESRGVHKQGTQTITSALRGKMKTEDKVRAEFLKLAE